MPEPSDTASKTTPGGNLSPDEADRIAARFRPVWEFDEGEVEAGSASTLEASGAALARGGLDEALVAQALADANSSGGADAKLGAPSSTGATEPIDIRDTAVDGVPAIEVGASAPSRTSPDGTPSLAAATDRPGADAPKVEAAPPSARRKKVSATKIGLGNSADEAPPASAGVRPGPRAGGAATGADAVRSARSSESKDRQREVGGSRTSGPVSARTASARAAIEDDPVEIPVEQGSKLVGWIAMATAAAVVLIGGTLWLSRGDDKPSGSTPTSKLADAPPKPTATTTAATQSPSSLALGSTPEPASTATAEPAASAVATVEPQASATATSVPTSAPKATSQPAMPPTSTPAPPKPPATATPPSTTKPPAGKPGGIIRDSPF